ncbi:Gfo/Idh/MocA family protein [Bacillus sp. N9]
MCSLCKSTLFIFTRSSILIDREELDENKIWYFRAAGIARKALIPAIQRSNNAEVTAIASGSGKAEQFAEEFSIPKVYGTYEALLADPDIDAVYIPLPNHLHKSGRYLPLKQEACIM